MTFKSFTRDLREMNDDSLDVILDTITDGSFPGSQLYLYFRLHTPWEEALDPSDFIADTARIYKNCLPMNEETITILSSYYSEKTHIENIYRILKEAWSKLS